MALPPTTEQLQHELDQFIAQGWTALDTEDGVERWNKTLTGVSQRAFMGVGTINKPADEVLAAILDPERRKTWDPYFLEGRTLADIDADTKVVYQVAAAGGPASHRDLCLLRVVHRLPDGKIAVITKSTERPDCPPVSGYVRADMLIGGFVVAPEGTASCRVTVCAGTDPHGWMPGFVAKLVGAKQPMVVARLRDYLMKALP
ncbi:putative START domain [Paratrimastix pyriformis]|uniref:START domain n=1 Tax=Paratrimastix pyriformis TaxID=342808 RepID=A0ABQ8UHF5_9EUKA|nr:putative START domain [Paratrimastix pyriformis]